MKFLLNPSLYILFLTLVSCELYAKTGGSGRDEVGPSKLLISMCALAVGMVLNTYMNYRISKRTKKVQKALQRMMEHEPEWNEEKLIKFAKERFMHIQNLKGMQKLEDLRTVLAYKFYLVWEKEIEAQIKRNERNSFSELEIQDAFIVDFKNYLNDNNDIITVCFDAIGNEQTLRKRKVVLENYSDFREFWTFRKQAGEWKLFEITQANGWEKFIDGKLVFEKYKKKSQHTIK